MRVAGIVLIIVGLLLMAFRDFSYRHEKNVIDMGSIKVNKEETRHVDWPMSTGGIIALAGVVLIFIPAKKSN